MDRMIGKVLEDKYRLTRLIGEGGMGEVYEAEHQRIHRQVAVKLMRPGTERSGASVERFHREAMAASAIGHPNIVEIFDVGMESDGTAFIVMELLRGVSLSALLKLEGVVVPDRALSFTLQILSALDAAHRKGIIHRDLKPDNIFLSVDRMMREVVKILDFGVAKIQGTPDRDLELTKSGVVFGSPFYLSPEQARGRRDLDHRVDIWAVGIVLYQMLSGKRPFDGENYNEILGRILMDEPRPLLDLAPEVQPGLARIVDRALAKDREQRFGTAAEMLEALLEYHDPSPDQMSTQVIRVLGHRDDGPPSEVDQRFRVVIPDARLSSDPSNAPVHRHSDPLSETMSSGPLPDLSARAASRTRHALLGGVAILTMAVAGIIVGPMIAGEHGAGTSEESTGAEHATPVSSSVDPAQADESDPEGEMMATPPRNVVLTFPVLPAGAALTVDGRAASPPLDLPRSESPVLLRITAPGHEALDKAVIPDRDQEIALSLVPLRVAEVQHEGPARSSSRKGGGTRSRTEGRDQQRLEGEASSSSETAVDEGWAENPFQ